MACLFSGAAFCAPVVSNISFTQKADDVHGSVVEIGYNLESPQGPCTIRVFVSTDGGAVYASQLTGSSSVGDIGANVLPGSGKKITWLVGRDFPESYLDSVRIKIEADDGFIIEGISIQMVDVAGGEFLLGEDGYSAATPVHAVTLSPYQIGRYEVTNQQYAAVLNWAHERDLLRSQTNGKWSGAGAIYAGAPVKRIIDVNAGDSNIAYEGGLFVCRVRPSNTTGVEYSMADHPVVRVSWFGAVAFCNWLSEIQELSSCYSMTGNDWPLAIAPPTVAGYRLPTEAEWECAARWDADTGQRYAYGVMSNDLGGSARVNYRLSSSYVNPLDLRDMPYTAPVGWFNGVNVSPNGPVNTTDSPSPVGCYDMTGNVAEWVHDWYSPYTSTPKTNPLGAAFGDYRVLRGGSYTDMASLLALRAFGRSDESEIYPADTSSSMGFRIARSR